MMDTANQDIWDAKDFLIYCAQTHPKAKIDDYMKRLYQSEFGGGYLITDEESSLRTIRKEVAALTERQKRRPYFDPFCSVFCRMNLSISRELSPELIDHIFQISSKRIPKMAWFRFEEKIRLLWELCQERPELFSFTKEQLREYLAEYTRKGYPPVQHSAEYIRAYSPSYRVIRKEYGKYPALYAAIERCLQEKGSVNVAIEGSCCSGKTEAADILSDLFDCNVFHMDDFFVPWNKQTPERMSRLGGSIDWERMRSEVCEKVKEGRPFSYRTFDASVMKMGETIKVQPKKVNVFEGVYSMHPGLRDYYDIKVFLTVPSKEQEARILERNGAFMLRRFLEEWVPMERAFFEGTEAREACDFVF